MSKIGESRVPIPIRPAKFIHKLRAKIRALGLSNNTEITYVGWIKRFIKYHGLRHPEQMGKHDVERYLHHLAVVENISINSQKVALNSLAFLYNQFLQQPFGQIDVTRAKRERKLPVVFSINEAQQILLRLANPWRLLTSLMYGSGLRVSEAVSLRFRDIDFENQCISVRQTKGNEERVTLLPETLRNQLCAQMEVAKALHQSDLAKGAGFAYVDERGKRNSGHRYRQLAWQYIFPASTLKFDARAKKMVRYHVHRRSVNRHIKIAIQQSNILKEGTAHSFRHSFATRLLEQGTNIREVQSLLGHKSIKTTEIYTHVLHVNRVHLKSPLDYLPR